MSSELEAGKNIFGFQVRHFFKNFFKRKSTRKQAQDISDSNSHASDTRTPPAFAWIESNSM